MSRRWLQSADVEIDDSSGALLVKIGDAELKVDMAAVDVSAIVAGITGSPDGKTLKDVATALASDGPMVSVLGVTSDVAAGDANGSINAHVRQVAKLLLSGSDSAATLLATIAAANVSVAQASSGTTAKTTTDNTAVDLIAADAVNTFHHARLYNTGSVAGFFSIDAGTTWHYLPAASSLLLSGLTIANKKIQLRRIADGPNVTGVYASVW